MRFLTGAALLLVATALIGCGSSEEAGADVQKPGKVEIVPPKPGMKSPEERGAESRAANGRKADEEGEGR